MNRTPAAIAALLLTIAVAGAARPAAAHDGEGVLALESQEVRPDGTASYQVRLTWEDDGHAAIDSTVTATPIAPDGTPGTPVVLQAVDQDGRYAGALAFADSGTWTVRFTSVTPAATSEVVEEVTLVPTTPARPEATSTSAATATTSGGPTDDESAAGGPEAGADDGGSSTGVVITLVVVLLLLAAIVAGFARSNRRLRDGP